MRRVVFNQKGGVGKSTITCNLAAISAKQGKRTLVIDLDPQCNSSQYLLSSEGIMTEATIGDFFEEQIKKRLGSKDLTPFITATPFDNLDLIGSHPDLDDLQVKLESRQKIYKLRDALNQLDQHEDKYDEVYIDTPPSLHFFTRSALIAATRCLIPFDCDDFSRQALYNLIETVEEIREDHNDELAIEGIVVNQFQANARLPKKLVDELTEEGQPLLKNRISASVVVKESHDQSVPLIHMAPSHKVTKQFVALHDELKRKRL